MSSRGPYRPRGARTGGILCVSGDGQTAQELVRMLAQNRFAGEVAASMEEALERIRRQTPSLILIDFRLADGSGLELISRLRAMPRTAKIPVLMLATGFQAEHYRAHQTGPAPQEWLHKPVDKDQLATAVRRWIGVEASGRGASLEAEPDQARTLPEKGSFAELPFARVLVLAGRKGPGRLFVQRHDEWLRVWVDGDTIVGLSSSYISGTSLGRMLVEGGRVDGDTLAEAQLSLAPGQRLGQWLVEHGILPEDELDAHLRRQVAHKLSGLFSWRWYDACWVKEDRAEPAPIQVSHDLGIKDVIFDGITRHYDRDRLEMIFTKRHRLRRPVIPTTPHVEGFPVPARRVMQAADGRTIPPQVRTRAGMEVMRFYQVLYALWVLEFVRFGDPVEGDEKAAQSENDAFMAAGESVGSSRRWG